MTEELIAGGLVFALSVLGGVGLGWLLATRPSNPRVDGDRPTTPKPGSGR
jgi:hypothetical protein